MTLEHVLPHWLTDFFLNDLGQRTFDTHIVTPDNEERRRWENKEMDLTVRRVCGGCNGGWMSELEGKAKPVLLPLLRGENLPITLSAEEQDLLGVWVYKTALMVDFYLSGVTAREYRPIPGNAYRRFYRSRIPLSMGVRVWAIPLVKPQSGLFMERSDHTLYHKPVSAGKKTIPGTRPNTYVITFTIHRAAFQVCGPLGGPAVLRFKSGNPAPLLQLFPRISDEVRWPHDGTSGLRWDDLHAFSRRTNFIPG